MMCLRDMGPGWDGSRCERPEGHDGICWPRAEGPALYTRILPESCDPCHGRGYFRDFVEREDVTCADCNGHGVQICSYCRLEPAEYVVPDGYGCGPCARESEAEASVGIGRAA